MGETSSVRRGRCDRFARRGIVQARSRRDPIGRCRSARTGDGRQERDGGPRGLTLGGPRAILFVMNLHAFPQRPHR